MPKKAQTEKNNLGKIQKDKHHAGNSSKRAGKFIRRLFVLQKEELTIKTKKRKELRT